MNEEELNKLFHRIELDKSSDSCGFEFADGFDCTFNNIATCYDDRLKLYELVKDLQQETQELKKQLEYLRSGEYYNQLRFENEMLQQVVDTNGVPSEVYDYIDCTHRNTELLEENQKLKDRDLIIAAELTKLQDENKQLKDKLSKIETLIINHNCDTGDIYYKYNSKFLKSELKQRILEIVYEEESDSNEKISKITR